MSRLSLVLLVVIGWFAVLPVTTAGASCSSSDPGAISANAGASQFVIDGDGAVAATDCQSASGGGSGTQAAVVGEWHSEYVCSFGGAATCAEVLTCEDGTPMTHSWLVAPDGQILQESYYCPSEGESVAAPVVITAEMAAQALRQVDLPASVLQVQPPGGRTLVNLVTSS